MAAAASATWLVFLTMLLIIGFANTLQAAIAAAKWCSYLQTGII
jgi:hypothetical protein